MALNINGRMKVKTLRKDFKKEFGLALRVYDGRSFADVNATLASIRKGDSVGGEFSPQRNTKVGNLEDKIMDMFGIKTQVAGSDDSYLCDNDKTLAGALEADEKLMVKRGKRSSKDVNVESEAKAEDSSGESNGITVEMIISRIKDVYKDHDDVDEMVSDLEGGYDFDYWAEQFATDDYNKQSDLAKMMFSYLEENANEFSEYINLMKKVSDSDGLNDQEWAKKLAEKALNMEPEGDDRNDAIEDIEESINDELWLSELKIRFGIEDDEEEKETHTIYIKSEPSGEFILGRLPEEEVELLKKLHGTDKYKESYLIYDLGYYNYDDLGHANGILSGCSKGDFTEDDDADIEFDEIAEIRISNEDGFYIYSTHLSKMSLEITFDLPDEEPFNPNKLKVEYVTLEMDQFETSRYGELYGSIYEGYYYDGEEIGEDEEMVDRFIESDIFIFQVKDEEIQCIYHRGGDDSETWKDFLN